MVSQGYKIDENNLYQDNNSNVILENNSKNCSINWTRDLTICCLFLTDQNERGNLSL